MLGVGRNNHNEIVICFFLIYLCIMQCYHNDNIVIATSNSVSVCIVSSFGWLSFSGD